MGPTTTLFNRLNSIGIAGPLFAKELRVSSRRRRNYALRFVYVVLLTAFIAIVWLGVVHSSATTTFQKSRMAVIGKTIISTIISFQFIALQLIAVVMLSTSISDEIYNRTLGLLMTTTVSSFQIVIGKLAGKLVQLILLAGVSIPLMAVVRVFGGVPWDYLVSSFCITLTAVIFAGSLSMYFSINNPRAFVVIIKTAFALGVLYAFLPAVTAVFPVLLLRNIGLVGGPPMTSPVVMSATLYLNPFAFMWANTAVMLSPGVPLWSSFVWWPLHCAMMAALSALILAVSVKKVRRAALRQATGQLQPGKERRSSLSAAHVRRVVDTAAIIRPVKGPPVMWKELRVPLIQGGEGRNSRLGMVFAIAALLITYVVCADQKCLDSDFTHASYGLLFVLLGIIFHIVLAAVSITSEKESRAWPILLATSMNDWHILLGKAAGVFRRCLPIWLLLAGHTVLFVIIRYIHPIAILHLAMIVAWLVVFITGSALYFSALFRHTTSAVVAGFALTFGMWAVLPAALGVTAAFTRKGPMFDTYVFTNPVIQTAIVMTGASGKHKASLPAGDLIYEWTDSPDMQKLPATTRLLLETMLGYMLAGGIFAWRAKCRFRRNIFGK